MDLPSFGVGVGLRRKHFDPLPKTDRRLDWIEFTPENYMAFGGRPLRALDACKERWQPIAHGVNCNLGGSAELDGDYLQRLKKILDRVDSPWFSDHLCWSAIPGLNTHELLPLPFTREAVDHVVNRIRRVRAALDRPVLIENISTYVKMPGSEMTEAQFVSEILEKADCGLLLDVNNVFVNGQNHREDPWDFFNQIPMERVVQIHLAGHEDRGDVLVDTHGEPVCDAVWDLFAQVVPRLKHRSILIEWDTGVPPVDRLLDEADTARRILEEAAAHGS